MCYIGGLYYHSPSHNINLITFEWMKAEKNKKLCVHVLKNNLAFFLEEISNLKGNHGSLLMWCICLFRRMSSGKTYSKCALTLVTKFIICFIRTLYFEDTIEVRLI